MKMRKKLAQNPIIKNLNIMDVEIFIKPLNQPVIFEDILIRNSEDQLEENFEAEENNLLIPENSLNLNYEGIHIVVLVHGF